MLPVGRQRSIIPGRTGEKTGSESLSNCSGSHCEEVGELGCNPGQWAPSELEAELSGQPHLRCSDMHRVKAGGLLGQQREGLLQPRDAGSRSHLGWVTCFPRVREPGLEGLGHDERGWGIVRIRLVRIIRLAQSKAKLFPVRAPRSCSPEHKDAFLATPQGPSLSRLRL